MIRFGKPGLVVYVTCGDPSLDVTRDAILAMIDAGADLIELGVPFSDPVADGPTIQRASERALGNSTTLADVLKLAADIRARRAEAGIIIFSYLNPILRFGLERFTREAKRAGLDGALVTDLTVEEAGGYRRLMNQAGLATVFLATPTSPDTRLKRIAQASTGFVYAVSRTGITGAQQSADIKEAKQLVKRIKRHTELPVAVGFGISTVEQFHGVAAFSDAAVIGSAIVKLIEDAGPARAARAAGDFVRSLKGELADRREAR